MNAGKWGLIGVTAFLLTPDYSVAQDDDDSVEEIVVTGSRLIRRDTTAPSPIMTIDRESILNSGQPTLEETLNSLPQVQPGFGRTSNNPGDGTAQIDLRGIGSGRTLVMLNGRRMAPAGIESSVDVNSLPSVLMERVEVITGGATTVYGADAIAGVVNFITRKDFDGFSLETSYYATEHGDSDILDVNVAWGHEFTNGNITLFGGWLDREPLFQADRSHSAQTLTDDWFTGQILPGGSTTTPAGTLGFPRVDWGSGPARTTWDSDGNPREWLDPQDRYDFGPINYMQLPLERISAGALFNYNFTDSVELYSELTFTRNEITQSLAPAGTFGAFFAINTDNPVLTPANAQLLSDFGFPLGGNLVGISLSRRLPELGLRIADSQKDYTRLLVGLRGELSENWDYDVWVTHTIGEETRLERNDGSYSRFQQGLLVNPITGECFDPSGGCVPINPFGEGNLSQAALDFFGVAPYETTVDRDQTLLSAYVRGTPFEMPAGDVAMALGVEWREDSASLIADEALFSGDTLGWAADSNVVGEESVSEIYGEAIIPLLSDMAAANYLGIEVGARFSDYDNAGELETWKVGADWEIVEGVRIRAMLQQSARAPNLREAGQIPFPSEGNVVFNDPRQDPCSASADPIGNGYSDICIAQGIPAAQLGIFEATVGAPVIYQIGGNPNLNPELADTFTAGLVITTWESWTIAIDYFDLQVEDTIGGVAAMSICFDPGNAARATCDRIQRDPLSYDVNYVDETADNLGNLETHGLDTQINYTTEVSNWLAFGQGYANIDISLIWTHVYKNSIQGDPASTEINCVGTFGYACGWFGNDWVFPEDRVSASFAWSTDDWRAQLSYRWIEGTDNSVFVAGPLFGFPAQFISTAIPSIGSDSYFDFSLTHDISDNVSVGLTIANLFDRDPAFLADNGSAANTDTEFYDVFGRAYTLRFKLNY